MRIRYLSYIFILACSLAGKAEQTNLFGIYLTTEPVDPRITAYGKGDWSKIKLADTPIISEADIIAYHFTNHLMTLRPEAIKRLPRPPVSGTPFVVVANGERIYLGVFMTSISSVSRGVPSIEVHGNPSNTNFTENTFYISRSYGEPPPPNVPDPRSNKRIRTALEKAKILR